MGLTSTNRSHRTPRIGSPHTRISAMDIDRYCDQRFLLVGGGEGTISIYDLWERDFDGGGGYEPDVMNVQKLSPVAQTRRDNPRQRAIAVSQDDLPWGHACSVASVQWYPVDTGVFVSSGLDGEKEEMRYESKGSKITFSLLEKTLESTNEKKCGRCMVNFWSLQTKNCLGFVCIVVRVCTLNFVRVFTFR